jgi:lipopolysaccharide biosynthesis glycosyltransferase
MSKFDLVYAISSGYEAHLVVSLISFFKYNDASKYKITIFSSSDNPCNQEKILNNIKSNAWCISFKYLDTLLLDELIISNHFKKENYIRLLLPRYISQEYFLYVDADTLFVGSIEKLIDLRFNYPIAAVKEYDYPFKKLLGLREDSEYFNSGLMVINTKLYIKDCIEKRVINFIRINPKKIKFVDQCGLNIILEDNWEQLDTSYNIQSAHIENNIQINSKKMIHFTGSDKPWHLWNKHPYKKMYWELRNSTEFKGIVSDDLTVRTIIFKTLSLKFKYRLKKLKGIFS